MNDYYEYDNNLLVGIKGSLACERQVSKPKNFQKLIKEARILNNRFKFSVSKLLTDPLLLEKSLAELTAEAPGNLLMNLNITGTQKILGKGQSKRILNLLLTLYCEKSLSEYMLVIILEPILKLVPQIARDKISLELIFVAQLSVLTREERLQVISIMYSENNLKQKRSSIIHLLDHLIMNFLNTSDVKVPQQPRGYSDKGFYETDRSKKRRSEALLEQEKELDIQRQRILKKQMDLFEANLDVLLSIRTPELSRKEIKDIIVNNNNNHQNILEGEDENDK